MVSPTTACAVALVALAGCSAPDPGNAPDGGAGPEPQGSVAAADLVVNEVAPRPADGPDWIEIVNRSETAIDLCGFFVTDALDRLDHYLALGGVAPPDACPPRMLEPGAYLVIVADDDVGAGADHAPFSLGVADEAHLVTTSGEAVDSLVYLYPAAETASSLARGPDAEGRFVLTTPTPGAPNPPVAEATP